MDRSDNEHRSGHTTSRSADRKHVYVVNGSLEFLDIVRQLLQAEHYNVVTTNFVPRTFESIQAAQPSLLVIDLVMGEQIGWELLARLRREVYTRNIPVLLVSTRPELLQEAVDRHDQFGGDRHLLKPFNLDELLSAIEELIGKS